MGRSVSYLRNSLHEVYFRCSDMEQWEWNDLIENLSYSLEKSFPSLSEADDWDGNETKIFLQNSFCEIGISEYCGLASLSIRVPLDIDEYTRGNRSKVPLAENWINKAWPKILTIVAKNTGDVYAKQGSFSNGEGVFGKVDLKKDLPVIKGGFCHNQMGVGYEF